MLMLIAFTFGCSKFLLGFRCCKFFFKFLDIEGFYFYSFYVIGPNFHYVSIHQHQNYVYKARFFF
jgi:hypothetical protein